MRPDYLVYRKATQVAGFGLLMQCAITLALLVFGLLYRDTSMVFASLYAMGGILVWLSLIVVFYQHGLERLEALEEDEAALRSQSAESVFAAEAGDVQVAARRLRLMHKWAMPIVSIALGLLLTYLGLVILRFFEGTTRPDESATDFLLTTHRGWAIAICLSIALVSFIFSRFVAGMSKITAWQNLRGGAGYMVGNSVVTLALAIGIIFRFFENDKIVEFVARALPFLLWVLALEIGLNFILNLYRPRIAGEVPRPAFDSRILSLLTTPDSIVRSVNEAVNYQFGFDIASSWGYQLLLRSLGWLLLIGVSVLVLLNTMVIVEPHQQAVRLRAGRIVDDKVYESGIMWKWPWPFETAGLYDVSLVREISLTGRQMREPVVNTWDRDLNTDVPLEPFIVSSPAIEQIELFGAGMTSFVAPIITNSETADAVDDMPSTEPTLDASGAPIEEPDLPSQVVDTTSTGLALVTAEIVMQYRIRTENSGLIDYLQFAPDTVQRRQNLTQRDRALKALALREVAQYLLKKPLDNVLADDRATISTDLRDRIQKTFDAKKTGIDVVSIDMLTVRPGSATEDSFKPTEFEDVTFAIQERLRREAEARQTVNISLTAQAGDLERADNLIREITRYDELVKAHGKDAPETVEQRIKLDAEFAKARGNTAQILSAAEAERWREQMGARGQAARVRGESLPYLAAPELYRQRRIMEVLASSLGKGGKRKFIIGVDPSRLQIDFDVSQLSDVFNFGEYMEDKNGEPSQ